MEGATGIHPDRATGETIMNPFKYIPALVVLLLLLSGCRKAKEEPLADVRPVPATVDEGGWPLYEQPGDGFALALPPGWTALKLDPRTLDRTLEQGLRVNPDLKNMEQS